jgi:hypothetical protein
VSSSDIAGIGTLISIMIQLAIPFLGLLAWTVSGIAFRLINARDCKSTSTFPHRRAKAKAATESFRDTITTTFNEFQRAQCCFAIAIDVATLIALYVSKNNTTLIDANATEIAAVSGMLPTTTGLAALAIM